jgi:hypothetical protein
MIKTKIGANKTLHFGSGANTAAILFCFGLFPAAAIISFVNIYCSQRFGRRMLMPPVNRSEVPADRVTERHSPCRAAMAYSVCCAFVRFGFASFLMGRDSFQAPIIF